MPVYLWEGKRRDEIQKGEMDVADEATLSKRILDFQDYYQETAKPFDWTFTASDLKERLDALKDHAAA